MLFSGITKDVVECIGSYNISRKKRCIFKGVFKVCDQGGVPVILENGNELQA